MKDTLDWTTTISTSLKVLVLGDSVGVQIAQGLQEASGGALAENLRQRRILRYTSGKHEGLFVAPTRGGGVVAGWRITALLQSKGENRSLPNNSGGGWVRTDVVDLLSYNYTNGDDDDENITITYHSFDTTIIRIPHGWMRLHEITREALEESVELAHQLFGTTSFIILSLPIVNNVDTPELLDQLVETNQMIREFALDSRRRNGTYFVGRPVLLLDFGILGDSLVEWNARLLGYDNTTNTDPHNTTIKTSSRDYLFRYRLANGVKIAQVCSEAVENESANCRPNAICRDGMHWCSETLNGPINAGIACLLACLHNHDMEAKMTQAFCGSSQPFLDCCETACNEKFMSVNPKALSARHFDYQNMM